MASLLVEEAFMECTCAICSGADKYKWSEAKTISEDASQHGGGQEFLSAIEKEYTSFSQIDEGLRLCDSITGVKDEHLNSEGNKVIADSVIKKLKQYESKTNKK